MYIQENSVPRAAHNVNPREKSVSAAAQANPAVINLLWDLPGILESTKAKPMRSMRSADDLRNSYK